MKYDFRKYNCQKALQIEIPGLRDSQYICMRVLRVLVSARTTVQYKMLKENLSSSVLSIDKL